MPFCVLDVQFWGQAGRQGCRIEFQVAAFIQFAHQPDHQQAIAFGGAGGMQLQQQMIDQAGGLAGFRQIIGQGGARRLRPEAVQPFCLGRRFRIRVDAFKQRIVSQRLGDFLVQFLG